MKRLTPNEGWSKHNKCALNQANTIQRKTQFTELVLRNTPARTSVVGHSYQFREGEKAKSGTRGRKWCPSGLAKKSSWG